MRHRLAGGAISLVLLFFSIDAAACYDDRDCPPTFDCVWLFGEPRGLCERGVTDWDEPSQVSPANQNTTEGKRCAYDSDCDEGMSCVAEGREDRRVCRRN